jgi:hypothetical protein
MMAVYLAVEVPATAVTGMLTVVELQPLTFAGTGVGRPRPGRRSRADFKPPWSSSHQRRLASPPASALPDRNASDVTTASSLPSRVGAWASHQRTSRISREGSASGSQPGQYERATTAASAMNSVT